MPLMPFARQSKPGTEVAGYSGERLINYFIRPSDGVSPGVLLGRSGLVPQFTIGAPVVAMTEVNGVLYAVAGGDLWRMTTAAVSLGSVGMDESASIAAGSGQVAVVSGGKYYLWDGTTLGEFATGAVDTPKAVTYQDGYFVVVGTGNSRDDLLTISALDNGRLFDGLDYIVAESNPDGLLAVISDHGQVVAFGPSSVEMFYNSGAAAFPFEPNRSAMITRGVSNPKTIAQEDSAIFWVGPDNVVYRYSGGTPQVISTREIEEALASTPAASALVFADRGHKFYCIRREQGASLTYDLTTGGWAERQTGDGPWIGNCAALSAGKQYIGTTTGKVCTFGQSVFTDDGLDFYCEAVSAPVVQSGAVFNVARVYLMIGQGDIAMPNETTTSEMYDGEGAIIQDGLGNAILIQTEEEPNGRVMLQTSKDGRVWSTAKWRPLGKLGEFGKRVMWHGLGQFRRFQVRIKITDPVRRDIFGVSYE